MNADPNVVHLLDHGYLRYVDHMGGDLDVVRAARTSHDAAWRTGQDEGKDLRLINYLMKHGHTTPFETVTFKFEVKAPIFVFRQWHRHRTQSYSEVSARYAELPNEYYVPESHLIGKQDPDNKQARKVVPLSELSADDLYEMRTLRNTMYQQNSESYHTYQNLLASGVPRELARSVLPVAMYSKMFATANLLNWLRFLNERLHPHAQYEIRVYAEAIAEFIQEYCPLSYSAFDKYMRKR